MEYSLLVKKQTNDNWVSLDVYDDISTKVVFNVQDVREPQSIKSNYTQEFTLPGTRRNRQFFETLDQGGFNPFNFTPNVKTYCQLISGDDIIIDGYLQVNKVIRDDSSEKQEYEIIIYGELSSMFINIENLKISDINLSEYNHSLTTPNIVDTWNGYIYKDGVKYKNQLGDGYVYPLEYRGQSLRTVGNLKNREIYEETDFKPAVFVKTIWDKAFKLAGKTYTSKFLNTEKFTRLVIPCNTDYLKLTSEEIRKREFRAQKSFDSTDATSLKFYSTYSNKSSKALFFDEEINDPANVWSGREFTPYLDFTGTLNINLTFYLNITSSISPNIIWAIAPPPAGVDNSFPVKVYLYDETDKKEVWSKNYTLKYPFGAGLINGNNFIGNEITDLIQIKQKFLKGHSYVLGFESTNPGTNYKNTPSQTYLVGTGAGFSSNWWIRVKKNSNIYFTLNNDKLNPGETVDMNQVLDKDIDLATFITDINTMHNLFWRPNPNKENDFIIEPKDDLYTAPTNRILDWTYKIDRDNEVTIQPLEEIQANTYIFKYSEDDDFYNEQYQNDYKTTYGSRTVSIVNDFKTETEEIDVDFAPTPLMVFRNNKVVPSYYKANNGVNEAYNETKLRILYWGGMITYSNNPQGEAFIVLSEGKSYAFSSILYPYAGHLDNPYDPTYDINFGQCKTYYYSSFNNLTQNNLVNTYWLTTINDLTAPDAHLLTATAHFTPYDIYNFNIFDTVMVDEIYYRINKVEYDIITEIATIELYKTTATNTPTLYEPQALTYPSPPVPPVPAPVPGPPPPPGPTPPPWKPGVWDEVNWGGTTYSEWDRDASIGADWSPYRPKSWWNATKYSDVKVTNSWNTVTTDTWNYGNVVTSSVNTSFVENDVRGNYYPLNSGVQVLGRNNNLRMSVSNVRVMGDNNLVMEDVSNVNIRGNNNYIAPSVSNVEVSGDNNYVTKSNATYDNGIAIVSGKKSYDGALLRGGINTVGNPFSATPPVIRAGINAVENFGGCKDVQVIRGGQNNTGFNDY